MATHPKGETYSSAPRMVLVDANTIGTDNIKIVETNNPVKVSSLGRLGLGLINSTLLWNESTYSGVPQQSSETVQSEYDHLLMKWQEAYQAAGNAEDETAEFYAEGLMQLVREHPELYPEVDLNQS